MKGEDWDYEMQQDAVHYLTEEYEGRDRRLFDYDPDLFFDDYRAKMGGSKNE